MYFFALSTQIWPPHQFLGSLTSGSNISGGIDSSRFGARSPVTIDATTQPGYAGAGGPVVQLDGAGAAFPGISLFTGADGSEVRGLSITDFNVGIAVEADDTIIEDTWLGQTTSGAVDGNNIGIHVLEASDRTRIGSLSGGGNIVVGSVGAGVEDGPQRCLDTLEIGDEHLNAAGRAAFPGETDGLGEDECAAVCEVIAVHAMGKRVKTSTSTRTADARASPARRRPRRDRRRWPRRVGSGSSPTGVSSGSPR